MARALTPENNTNLTSEQALHFDTFMFPMIDLCTIEFPESERPDTVYYHRLSERPHSRIKGARTGQGVPGGQTNETEHRIRHNSNKGTDETNKAPSHRHLETIRRDNGDSFEEITWAEDLDGHQIRKQIIVQKSVAKSQNDQQDNER